MSEDSNAGRIIGIIVLIIVLLGALAGGWYFFMYKPEQEAKERARLEQIKKAEEEKKRQEEAARKKVEYDALIVRADSVFALEDWETAQSLYSQASTLLPNQQYAKDQLAMVNGQLQEIESRRVKVAAGEVETITSRTGRYYVIVSSSIDDDLAMDYARKLANEGSDVKMIEHNTANHIYFRVALGDYDSEEAATAALPSFGNYGEGVWVLRF